MMRSLFAGVSGLRNHQIRMDVIGNNIANVNTVGFKSSRVNFQEVFNQTLRGASSPTAALGGTNPQQVGLGMTIAAIDNVNTQGNLQVTGKMTDLAIQGDGYFILDDGGQFVYTRAGAFDRDGEGYLVNPSNGMRVQGWMATNGVLPTLDANNLTDLRIAIGQSVPASPTSQLTFANNLDANTAVTDTFTTSETVYNSLGNPLPITFTFTKTATNTWDWSVGGSGATGTGTITFNPDGSLATGGTGTVNIPAAGGAAAMTITTDFAAVTQFADPSTAAVRSRNGYPSGSLRRFTIDARGVITGEYTNGQTQTIGQVAVANFSNPNGLVKLSDNNLAESNNSGLKQIGVAGTAGRGTISPSSLEMSNVDLSGEFTNMIITQRGFQANSRIITVSDELLQDLVNLKR